jgi:hypothetical protein
MTLRADQEGLELIHDGTQIVRKDGTSLKTSTTGNTHTVAAGSTTTVFTNTTFDGGLGGSAYTVGDVVKALKNAGILG